VNAIRGSNAAGRAAERLSQFFGLGRRRLVADEGEILAEIRGLRGRLPHIHGVLVATVDGLLIAHDTRGIEPETMAAMSAAYLGLSQQLATGAGQGDFEEAVTRAGNGYTAVFMAGANALLTVLADGGLNVGRLHHEARPTAARVGELIAAATPRVASHRPRVGGEQASPGRYGSSAGARGEQPQRLPGR
jgi:uncharacterized protein